MKKGLDVLRDKSLNRSIAFTAAERKRLGLRGLLPHRVTSPRRLKLARMRRPRDLKASIARFMYEP